ncbi:MAG: S8 family peptidase, partial [Bacteroidota bacterium]
PHIRGYYLDDHHWDREQTSHSNHLHNHGCAVTGIIGAKGDNETGITGVNWTVKLMLISGATFASEIVEAYGYAYDMRQRYNQSNGEEGAFVVVTNYSAGINFARCEDFPIWGSMYDSLGQVGILSVGSTANDNVNVDEVGDMPTSCPSDFLLTVTNTNRMDDKVEGSGYGLTSIDLGAPGATIVSTKRSDTYGDIGTGTSWSAPHVTGAIALLYSLPCEGLSLQARLNPSETAQMMREVILDGVDPSTSLENKTVTGGRLNVFNSMSLLQDQFGSQVGPLDLLSIRPSLAPSSTEKLLVEYQTPEFTEYEVKIYNSVGQLILSGITPQFCAPRFLEVPIFGLAPGTYFMSIENVNDIKSGRFVIY